MNPTLSERLLSRRSDGFFRAHPAAPWDALLETPVALQTLALVQPAVEAQPTPATSAPTTSAPATSAPATSTSAPELLVLVLMAVVWLVDGWLALRQGLRRRPTAPVSSAAHGKARLVAGPARPSSPRARRRPAPVLVA
ncbi:hypothetical protein [Cyanobium sp. LEGE 06113]|uniref:hypothetical protein n=1 Tax=Cyanobium sp. LEGE 06113 TaxID=1297573 RepID=UPI0018803D63|nr:hypothetical protein [Cyanobium sp. LEGE 06113]MBE9153440.1 hypothetical protein [Cyanobium sp. LEGE 06113]